MADVQLIKKRYRDDNGDIQSKTIYPISLTSAIVDLDTQARLSDLLSMFNSIYLPYKGSPYLTRISLPYKLRRRGITITWIDTASSLVSEMCIDGSESSNDNFGLDKYWSSVKEDIQVVNSLGDSTIAAPSQNAVQKAIQTVETEISNLKLASSVKLGYTETTAFRGDYGLRLIKKVFPFSLSGITYTGINLFLYNSTASNNLKFTWVYANDSFPDIYIMRAITCDITTNNVTTNINISPSLSTYDAGKITDKNGTTSFVFNYTLTDGDSFQSPKLTFYFVNKFYYGAVAETETTVTTAEIKSGKSGISASRANSITYDSSYNGKKIFYAYPKAFGALTSIIGNNYEYIHSCTQITTTDLIGETGHEETYYVYLWDEYIVLGDPITLAFK